jgi:hypothetical protein
MPDELFTREEVLRGLPAKRARTLLFLIERHTAHLAAEAEQLTEPLPMEGAVRERDLAFLQAFALGREPAVPLTIQDVERYAPQWAHLAPETPQLRAGVAHLLGHKYAFTARAVPGIRAALGLDQHAVQHAYHQLYGKRLDTIYAPHITFADRLRWAWASLGKRLVGLPPFWFAFAFTFALGIPQAVVAFPIAVAAVGPLPGIALTLGAGLVSVVTTSYVAEAAARSGIVRYGMAYIGKLTNEYLGAAGAGLFTLALFVLYLVTVMGGFFAISRTLAQFTHIPATAWTALLFAAGMYLLARGSVSFSVTLLLALAFAIVTLILFIMVLTAGHFRVEYLTRLGPSLTGGSRLDFENTIGVILMGYFAEAFVVQCAKVVLPRDPSGRSLIWGSIAGLAGIAVILSAWILIINGSLPPETLAGQKVTVVTSLAVVIGSAAVVPGSLLVLLLPGLAAIRCMISAFNVVREWLPAQARPVVILPRSQGRLLFCRRRKPGGSPAIGLSYLGLDRHQPRFRLDIQLGGKTQHEEMTVAGHWDVTELFDQLPDLRRDGMHLALDVLDSTDQSVRLQVTSPLALRYEGNWHMEPPAGASPTHTSPLSRRAWDMLGDRGSFLLSVSPIVVIFLLAEWFLLTGKDSFPGVLAILGVLTSSVFSGFIPVLLLIASRRKGEVVPGVVLPLVGHPLVLGGVYVLYVAILLFHGLVIWSSPLGRTAALLTTALAVGTTVAVVRGGALRPRLVVELREDLRQGERSAFTVVADGQPAAAGVRFVYADGEQRLQSAAGEIPRFSALRGATFHLPDTPAKELKVWAHRVTPDGNSEGLPALVEAHCGSETKRFDLKLTGGQVVLPFDGRACRVEITFA